MRTGNRKTEFHADVERQRQRMYSDPHMQRLDALTARLGVLLREGKISADVAAEAHRSVELEKIELVAERAPALFRQAIEDKTLETLHEGLDVGDESPVAREAARAAARREAEAVDLAGRYEHGHLTHDEFIAEAQRLEPTLVAEGEAEIDPDYVPDPNKEPVDLDSPQYLAFLERQEQAHAASHPLAGSVVRNADGGAVTQGEGPVELS
jgi:hypothetical protein